MTEPTCTCVRCGDCNGSGSVWLDFQGNYLGNQRCDDLDELEYCENCGGTGVVEVCEHCHDAEDRAADEEERRELALSRRGR